MVQGEDLLYGAFIEMVCEGQKMDLRSEKSRKRKEERQDCTLRNSSFWRSQRELAPEAGREQDSVA